MNDSPPNRLTQQEIQIIDDVIRQNPDLFDAICQQVFLGEPGAMMYVFGRIGFPHPDSTDEKITVGQTLAMENGKVVSINGLTAENVEGGNLVEAFLKMPYRDDPGHPSSKEMR
jgi:hypothetical protein